MPYKLDNKKQIYERIPIPPFFLPFPLIARLPCSVLLWWPQSARILTLCDDHVCVSMWAIVPMSPGSGRVRSESPDHKTLPPPLTTTAPPPAHVQLITVFDPRMSSEQRLWPQMTRVRSSATTGEWWPHTDQGGLTREPLAMEDPCHSGQRRGSGENCGDMSADSRDEEEPMMSQEQSASSEWNVLRSTIVSDTEPDNKQTSDSGQPEQTPIPGHIRYKTPIKSQIKKIKHSLFLDPRTN